MSKTSGPRSGVGRALFVVSAALVSCAAPSPSERPGPGRDATTTDPPPRPDAALAPCTCPSRVCLPGGACAAATTADGVKNGDETDIDCGGVAGPRCGTGLLCLARRDCASAVCTRTDGELRCAPPRPDDGVRNADESGVDCGGTRAPACPEGDPCGAHRDCQSRVCVARRCAAPGADFVRNGDETDVDCGGAMSPPCATGQRCRVAGDCATGACAGGRCAPPSASDGVKNGDETDIDCGGLGNPPCRATRACARDADCESLGCAYDGRCAERRSCVAHFGGDTCGRGELGAAGAAHESCCASAPVASGARLGTYGVTAGRVRVFLDAVRGDVRGFVRRARSAGAFGADAVLLPAWDAYLPTSFEGDTAPGELAEPPHGGTTPIPGIYTSVYRHVSGFVFRNNEQVLTGCTNGGPGTHTVYVPDEAEARLLGDVPHAVARAIVDTKGANCVSYLFAQAFCAWDGGRLQLSSEYDDAWGAALYPWGDLPHPFGPGSGTYFGNRFPTTNDAALRAAGSTFAPGPAQSLMVASYNFSYEHPSLVATDYAVFIPAPGRMLGRGPRGHSLNDGLMELSGTFYEPVAEDPFLTKVRWTRNGSFEGHTVGGLFTSHLLNKYGKLGFRCSYPASPSPPPAPR